jgi:RNA polymerase sigma-70 factor (ECF subfamily)
MPDVVFNISLQPEMQISTNDFADGVELTDERLVQAVLEGDENAFGEIFDRYKRHVTRTVSRFFRDRSDIEDFVQQSFTKAYFSLKNFRGGAEYSLTSWLTKIAVNVCYDEFRRRQRRGESLFTDITTEEKDFLETIADNRNGSAENAVVAFQLVEKLLSGLDPRDRIALTMVYSDNYSLTETANAIGISSSNLKSRLFRCRSQLKAKFGHLFQ